MLPWPQLFTMDVKQVNKQAIENLSHVSGLFIPLAFMPMGIYIVFVFPFVRSYFRHVSDFCIKVYLSNY